MSRIDGRALARAHDETVDVVVVGSGPAGATVARHVAASGARVALVEAGTWLAPEAAERSAFGAMSSHYAGMGATVMLGPSPMPYLQGRAVGGGSVINGAICWRVPRDVYGEWVDADPALAEALPWDELDAATDEIEADLNVHPTERVVAGRKNLLMEAGAEALGLEHRPIRRNTRGCIGRGLCLQGCPGGNKLSLDQTYVRDAEASGAIILSAVTIEGVLRHEGRAVGVEGRADGGGRVRILASRAVVLAASAVQTPALLLHNRITHGPVGENFQCHPGVSMAGRFPDPVRMWEGATQGHEVIGLRHEGLKFETLGFGPGVLASRLEGVGSRFAVSIADMAYWIDWGAAVRASARGRVRSVGGKAVVTFAASRRDVRLFRRGLRVMGEMMFAAGAERVTPGVHGFDASVDDPRRLQELEEDGPAQSSAYVSAVTHMFGTCAMGSDPAKSVVRPDFRHHTVDQLYVADSSVFPTNLGVNPQIPIMAMATLCARGILA